MATVSKDRSWKFWDINGEHHTNPSATTSTLSFHFISPSLPIVRYALQEDPRLLKSADLPEQGPSLIALSPDAKVAAVSINTSIFLYSTATGEIMEALANIHGCESCKKPMWQDSYLLCETNIE